MIKDTDISAAIDKNAKIPAESISEQAEIPGSTVINTLSHQASFPLTHAKTPKLSEEMTREQLDTKLQHSYKQAISHQGRPLNDVFSHLERKHD